MKKLTYKTERALYLVLPGLLVLYLIVTSIFGSNPPLYFWYLFKTYQSKDQTTEIARCENISWQVMSHDFATKGINAGIDTGRAVPPQISYDRTLIGRINENEVLNIVQVKDYRPDLKGFKRVKSTSSAIVLSEKPVENLTRLTIVDAQEYELMEKYKATGGEPGSYVMLLPRDNTLSGSDFDALTDCYVKHSSEIRAAFPVNIVAFGRP